MKDRAAAFATVDPFEGMTEASPGRAQNLAGGQWVSVAQLRDDIVDPMNGRRFLEIPDTQEFGPFMQGLASCPKTGLHNPMKNTERYVMLGRVSARAAALLAEQEVADYFTRLIQRVMPKSWNQCAGEVQITRVFLENFAGDGVRFLARGADGTMLPLAVLLHGIGYVMITRLDDRLAGDDLPSDIDLAEAIATTPRKMLEAARTAGATRVALQIDYSD